MPNVINITRGAAAPLLRRSDVKFGQVFALKKSDGTVGKNYLAIGMNGRQYSVAADTRELVSSDNPSRRVSLTGTWSMRVTMLPTYRQREVLRSQVTVGEIFKVKGNTRQYAHIGKIFLDQRGWLSVPLDNTDNHAVTKNGDSHVVVIGSFTMNAVLAR